MTVSQAASRPQWNGLFAKYVVAFVGFALFVLAAHSGLEMWFTYRDTKAALPTFAETLARLPGPLGAYTSVGDCAEALVQNLERRGRRVFVPRAVGVVAAWRQVVTGVLGERLVLAGSRTAVPRLEREIADLQGQEFGAHSVEAHRSA